MPRQRKSPYSHLDIKCSPDRIVVYHGDNGVPVPLLRGLRLIGAAWFCCRSGNIKMSNVDGHTMHIERAKPAGVTASSDVAEAAKP